MLIGVWEEERGAQISFKRTREGGVHVGKGAARGCAVCEVGHARGSLVLDQQMQPSQT